jgi:Cu/Ag efflux pump CusA
MIARLIAWSARNLLLVLFGTGFAAAAGIYALVHLPLDAIPDLSDTQVIVYTEYPGQAPQVIEDQVTYPLILWRLLRLRHLRGWYRHLLGALARARVPQRSRVPPAGRRHADDGA